MKALASTLSGLAGLTVFLLTLLTGCRNPSANWEQSGDIREELAAGYAKQGVYLGLQGLADNGANDFDGQQTLFGPTDATAVPDLGTGGGVGVMLGYRWRKRSLEFSANRTDYDSIYLGTIPFDANLRSYDLEFREYFRVEEKMQPFLYMAYGDLELTAENANTNGALFQDAVFRGQAVRFGGGLSFYLSPRIALFAKGAWSWAEYGKSKGIDGTLPIAGKLDGSGLMGAAGATITL